MLGDCLNARTGLCFRVCVMEFEFVKYGGLLVHSLCTSVFLLLLCLAVQTVVGIGHLTGHFGCTFSAIFVRLAY